MTSREKCFQGHQSTREVLKRDFDRPSSVLNTPESRDVCVSALPARPRHPSSIEIGFSKPARSPSSSFRSAIGYTPPPPTVLSFPVTSGSGNVDASYESTAVEVCVLLGSPHS